MMEVGAVVDQKYRIVRKIGEGGMGAVFEAEAIRLHRRVAIKVLRPVGSSQSDQESIARRFQMEAQAAGRIGSRHIVEVIDLGQLPQAGHFMVMEYLDGESLRDRLTRSGRMTVETILPIAHQLLSGVIAAHNAGIVHRDLKPDNVFLVRQPDGTDFVKLLDFGISKFGSPVGDGSSLGLTRTGSLLGTPFYLSPEQASGSKTIDLRVDIYAVGVILYECLAGTVPFGGDSINELLFKIVLDTPTPVGEVATGTHPHFCALVERAMAKDPSQRFQTALEMQAALRGGIGTSQPAMLGAASREGKSPSVGLSQVNPAPSSGGSVGSGTLDTWANSSQRRLPSWVGGSSRRVGLRIALGAGALLAVGTSMGLFFALGDRSPSPTGSAARSVVAPAPASPAPSQVSARSVDAKASRDALEVLEAPPGPAEPLNPMTPFPRVVPVDGNRPDDQSPPRPSKSARRQQARAAAAKSPPASDERAPPPGRSTSPPTPSAAPALTRTRTGRVIRSDL